MAESNTNRPPSAADVNPETFYDDMAQGLAAEEAAMSYVPNIDPSALPDKTYLEQMVLPLLTHGLEAVVRAHPADALDYLAAYLISNNPQRDGQGLPQPAGNVAILSGQLPQQQLPAGNGGGGGNAADQQQPTSS